jgi:alpha-beta hydrolase superfamily lysophospholipase
MAATSVQSSDAAAPSAGVAGARPHGGSAIEEHVAVGSAGRLYRAIWTPTGTDGAAVPKARLVLAHGYAEHCRRYDELAEYLLARGYEVWRFDACGHGQSSGQRGHVEDFSEYVTELVNEVASARHRRPELPVFLLGHSNGGLAAILAVEAGLAGVSGLILSSPLLGLRKKAVPDALARFLSAVAPRLPLPNGLRAQDLTHDPQVIAAHRNDRAVHRVATPRWYWSMTLAGRRAIEAASRVQLPLLTLRAEQDPIVDSALILAFHERAASQDKELVTLAGAHHEVLNELDRADTFKRVADWLDRVRG